MTKNIVEQVVDVVDQVIDVIEDHSLALWMKVNMAIKPTPQLSYEDFQKALNTPDDVFTEDIISDK